MLRPAPRLVNSICRCGWWCPRDTLALPVTPSIIRVAKIGRNDPCPCGSGRKYKLCHGAVAIAAVALPAAPGRECGSCTACCEGWAEGEIRGHRMFPGQHCHFLQQGACTIYAERPQSPCRNFICAWLAPGSPFPEEFRPDKVGVIIVPLRWHDRPSYVLLSAGRDPDGAMLSWMQAYARSSGSPFYHQQDGERLGYGPAAFQQEMVEKLKRGEKLW